MHPEICNVLPSLTISVCRGFVQGTTPAEHFQCLHYRIRPWSIRHPHCDFDLPLKLRLYNRTVCYCQFQRVMACTHTFHRRASDIDLEGEFEPSLLNSAIYLLQLIQQISTFSINYQGRPFRESIGENKAMYWGLIAASGVAFSCATEFIPEINEKLRLVPFSNEFKITLTVLMVIDYAGCWLIETVLKNLFSDFRPKDIAVRRPDQLQRETERKAQEQREAEAQQEQQRKV